VVIGGNANAVFARLMTIIGRLDLAEDPELASGRGRGLRSDELNAAIAAWTKSRTVEEVLAELEKVGVPAGPVHDASAIADDPHYRARDMLLPQQVDVDGAQQSVRFPGIVPKMPGSPGEVKWPGPELGEHTDEVLTDLLGVSAAELSSLRTEGVIS
jgi:formyl-CoA transferase